ncbi:amino acid adenylation protein [Burkholderia sp. SRS-W-2-2016]|uniref:amino acid adenylation domain-containing protein n=1 Tax=Burkholderia sp. SRS-W-2-2016 TaxID=1926878 RepID=UPI00094AC79A|nr:amino acid adenylation domain-containing protein [Burkholderia sp. SRS-W-2-2016]OLL28595.1 amino acid adenylation protein [Burkholderia sp. SRS-W-2-2016]
MNLSTIDGRFAERVRRTPERIALAGTQHAAPLTYRELDRCANRLAAVLARQGVTQGASVLLMLPRCANAVIAMLAIVKLGAVFVPLDPNYPETVKHAYARDSAARHAIAAAGDDTLRDLELSVLHIADLPADGPGDGPGDEPPPVASHGGDAPAYVMFTSGSTGKPKGVVVPHRGVVRLVDRPNYIAIQPDDTFLLLSPITFDASTFEIWGALLNGARLVVYDSAIFDPNLVSLLIRDERVSVMWLTAALFHLVVRRYPTMLTGLRVLLAGGDVLQADAVNAVLDAFPGITVVNGYGPTENTTFTCCHVMTRDNRPDGTVPIGRPVTGTSVLVARGDGDLAAVPDGQEGELYAGGDGVALGYLNRPDATRASFVPDPLGAGLLYRTGDIVRRRTDGTLEFIGRRDRLTKIRGYRVSLDEVQQLVSRLPCVEECVVQVREDRNGEKSLVATVQTNEQRDNMSAFIRSELRKLVPGFMIPDAIAVCAELPVNANGKVDRFRLASPI